MATQQKESGPKAAEQVKGEPSDLHRSDHVQLRTQTSGDRPDQLTVSNPNEEPFYGHFVTVTGGEYEGAFGVYVDNSTFDEKTGKPSTVLVRRRGAENDLVLVNYADIAPAESRGNAPR